MFQAQKVIVKPGAAWWENEPNQEDDPFPREMMAKDGSYMKLKEVSLEELNKRYPQLSNDRKERREPQKTRTGFTQNPEVRKYVWDKARDNPATKRIPRGVGSKNWQADIRADRFGNCPTLGADSGDLGCFQFDHIIPYARGGDVREGERL